jgi:hypothetical protein
MPSDASARRESLSVFAEHLFQGLRAGNLGSSFASALELEAIIVPEARYRLERVRASSAENGMSLASFQREWRTATFVGFCAQGAHNEPARGSLGLTQPGWVLDRLLLAARGGPSGPRSASWLEGEFVYTARGWRALSLRRIEAPRRQHSDLELAPCDVEAGLR